MFPVSDRLSPKMKTSENVSADAEAVSVKLRRHEHQIRFHRDFRLVVSEWASWMCRMIRSPSQSVARSASLEFTDMVTQVQAAGRPRTADLAVSLHYELFFPKENWKDVPTRPTNPKVLAIPHFPILCPGRWTQNRCHKQSAKVQAIASRRPKC